MSYDLINGYATTTGHHTALYSTSQQKESTDNAVQYLLKIGVEPAKIIIGAAFYARVWAEVPPANNGLYQQGKFKEGISYKDFPARMSKAQGYECFWDADAQAPYAYNATEKKFATYEDTKSIEAKTKYVLDKKLGGIMFWEISGDATVNSLVNEIHHTILKAK
jgi:chitinase